MKEHRKKPTKWDYSEIKTILASGKTITNKKILQIMRAQGRKNNNVTTMLARLSFELNIYEVNEGEYALLTEEKIKQWQSMNYRGESFHEIL